MMVAATIVCASLATQGHVDRQQLIRLVEGARGDVGDFAFEYEGDYSYPPLSDDDLKEGRLVGVQQTYSGTFVRRSDGATFVEIYSTDNAAKQAWHTIVSTLHGTTEISTRASHQARASLTIRRGGDEQFRGPSNFGRLFLIDEVLDLARSRLVYEFEGVRELDGRDCLVVRFLRIEDASVPRYGLISETYWIDLERGGLVLRHERRIGKNLMELTTGIRVQPFRTPSGKLIWLPVDGQLEGWVTINPKVRTNPRVYTDEPVSVEKYHLLLNSLRFEQGIKDDRFSVKAKPGDLVSDEVRKARYEFGQYLVRGKDERSKPITDAEVRRNLDKMLSDSEVLARELMAPSVRRSGSSWMERFPWIIAGLSSTTLIALMVRRQLAR